MADARGVASISTKVTRARFVVVGNTAARVNSSGLWISSRTRGGAGGMLRLQAVDFRSAR